MRHLLALLVTPLLLLMSCAAPPDAGVAPDSQRDAMAPDAGETILEQYAATNRYRYGAATSLAFVRGGDALLYLRSGARDAVRDLYELDLATGEERLVITAERLLGGGEEELTAEELARRERKRDAGRGLASFSLSPDGETVLLPLSGRLFVMDRASGRVRELGEGGGRIDARFSPDASMIGFARDGDLWVMDVATGTERRLTASEHPRVSYGEAEFVAQEEMGRDHGYWWAPGSERVLYQRTDTRDVVTFRIMDPADPGKAPREWAYPRAGTNNAVVTLHLRDLESGATLGVQWDRERYPYLATVKWPNGAPLTLVVQTRDQRESAVLTVDIESGATEVLHVERDDAWVDLDQSVPRWLEDGSGFFWSTERNGGWQLELRNADGSLRRVVTGAADGYKELLGVSGDEVFFRARVDQIETHVMRARLDPALGSPRRMSAGVGLHGAVFSDDARFCAHRGELADGTVVSEVRAVDGGRIVALPNARESVHGGVGAEFTVVSGARAYNASIVRPKDYDPERQYPVLVRIYGGPTSVMVRPAETSLALDRWFADHGMIVVRFDGRGTPGRGSDWLRAVDGDFISAPLDDLTEFVTLICGANDDMDAERVGIFGWSWGGYYSAMAACRRPDVFASAVIGAPVADWLDYDTHYTERYMGVPGEEGVDYEASSVLTYADGLRIPALLIHGTSDDNVYFTHSAKLADAWLRAGIPFEFLPLAGQTHSVTEPEVVVPMYERIAEFFVRTLGVD